MMIGAGDEVTEDDRLYIANVLADRSIKLAVPARYHQVTSPAEAPAGGSASERTTVVRVSSPSVLTRARESLRFRARKQVVRVVTGPVTSALRKRAAKATRVEGVTIITVNFNTLPYLKVMVEGVRRHSPKGVRIMVVDNASSDGTAAWARQQPGVRLIHLPINLGHGPAMDIGILLCETTNFVAMDVDAFPLTAGWLDEVVGPIGDDCHVSGAELQWEHIQPYVHACCLAMRTSRFVEKGHTFRSGPTWDTAQRISQIEYPAIHTIPATQSRGPVAVGTVFGDNLIYHNFYSARFKTTAVNSLDEDVRRGDPELAWAEAIQKYFPGLAPDA